MLRSGRLVAKTGQDHFLPINLLCSALLIAVVLLGTSVAHAAVLVVPAGGDFQGALNAAQPGDTIVLQAAATYSGSFTLPVKGGSEYITIQSSSVSSLADGVRVTPAQASLMARVQAPSVDAAIKTVPGSHHYRFIGIEFTNANAGAISYGVVKFGDGDSAGPQTTLSSVPHHLIIDRCYIHGLAGQNVQRGVGLNSADTSILNSYISQIHWVGNDTQAIGGWNGPGPYQIINNYLEAAGENVMFGGARPAIPNLVPSDIVIRGNHFFKPLSWRIGDPAYAGTPWTIKNLLELKSARRIEISDNLMENCWPQAQVGWAVIFNAFRDGGWEVIEDVQFVRNRIRNSTNGINLRGMDDGDTALRMRRVTIADNYIEGLGSFGSEGKSFQVLMASDQVTIDHNTVSGAVTLMLMIQAASGFRHSSLAFKNNLIPHGSYGVFGDGGLFGVDAFNALATNWILSKNAMIETPTYLEVKYPGNYFPLTLTAATGLLGTDNLPVGVRTQGSTPTPTPTPTPTATPTPTPTPTPGNTPPSVTLDNPAANAIFASGQDIQLAATASDSDGSISKVEFYRNASLLGTSITSPYSFTWTTVPKGNYQLTAKAIDDRGAVTTSTAVSISVNNSPNRVNHAKGRASNLVSSTGSSSVVTDDPAQSAEVVASRLLELTADIQNAINEFDSERATFGSVADRIDAQLRASLLFSKNSASLSLRTPSSGTIRNNLLRIVAHLAMAEDLMLYSTITATTTEQARQVNARTDVTIGSAITGYGIQVAASIAPLSLGTVAASPASCPLSSQMRFATGMTELSYELSGVSVSIGGVTVPLLYIGPGRIMFFVPAEVPLGTSQVIVTSQEGYVSTALATVAANATKIMTSGDDDNGTAVVLNSMTRNADVFGVTTDLNFSTDKRTRLSIFATGIRGGAANTNTSNDVTVSGVVRANFAESVTVEARLSDGRVYLLPVEFAGEQGTMPGLDQVNVILIPQLQGAGRVTLTLIVGGERSNAPGIIVR